MQSSKMPETMQIAEQLTMLTVLLTSNLLDLENQLTELKANNSLKLNDLHSIVKKF